MSNIFINVRKGREQSSDAWVSLGPKHHSLTQAMDATIYESKHYYPIALWREVGARRSHPDMLNPVSRRTVADVEVIELIYAAGEDGP